MKRTRPLLLVLASAPTLVVAAIGYFVVAGSSPGAAFSRALLDAGLIVFLVLAVLAVTQVPGQLVKRLIEALRDLSIGHRDRRLEPEAFGDLGDVARAFNELAAALSDGDDPNLGEVKSRPRGKAALEDKAAGAVDRVPPWKRRAIDDVSAHPDVGPVRSRGKGARPKNGTAEKAGAETAAAERDAADEGPQAAVSEHAVPEDAVPEDAVPEDAVPEDAVPEDAAPEDAPVAADHNEPSERPPEASGDERAAVTPDRRRAADTTVDDEEPRARAAEAEEPAATLPEQRPSFEAVSAVDEASVDEETRLRGLFQAFVQAKQENDEATDDLEYTGFVDTLREESERLRASHGCRDVRFEVRLQNGEVSLLPRLLR